MLTWLQYHRVGHTLDFMTKFGKELQGKVIEVTITINEYHKHIVYEVELEDGRVLVDGETFRQI